MFIVSPFKVGCLFDDYWWSRILEDNAKSYEVMVRCNTFKLEGMNKKIENVLWADY